MYLVFLTFSSGALLNVYSLTISSAPFKLFTPSIIDNGPLGLNRVEPRVRTNNIKTLFMQLNLLFMMLI